MHVLVHQHVEKLWKTQRGVTLLTLRDQLNRAWKHGRLKQCPFGNRTICFQAFCLLGSRLDCFNIKNISSKSIATVEFNVCESILFAQRLRPWFVAWQSNPQCPNTWGGIYKGAEKLMSGNQVHQSSQYTKVQTRVCRVAIPGLRGK